MNTTTRIPRIDNIIFRATTNPAWPGGRIISREGNTANIPLDMPGEWLRVIDHGTYVTLRVEDYTDTTNVDFPTTGDADENETIATAIVEIMLEVE